MTIAIIGAGAIGSVAAAYLTKAGEDVTLIGRKDQVEAIQKNGLRVVGARGEEIFPVQALARLDREYDLVIFTVKTQDIEAAYNANQAFLKKCLVLSSQNGVQSDTILAGHFDKARLYSSIVMFGATYTEPGQAVVNFEGDWIIGKPFGPNDGKLNEIVQTLKKAFSPPRGQRSPKGEEPLAKGSLSAVVVSDNITGMKWLKLFVNFNNCIPALTGKSMQETFADMDLCRLSILLLKEGLVIVRKSGIALVSLPQFPAERIYGMANMPLEQAAGIINKTLTSLSKEPLYGSILQSIMRGRTSEIDYINGQVLKMVRSPKDEAPLNARAVEMVHQVEQRKKYFTVEEIKEAFELNRQKV
ncbi:MAG: 2-dehydropantoate 2-reductase [Candidatus Omnitrophica bacterium]|nr:2-dehydropantoate 2-reductase [Candidatus Omnitrophota bacterium]